jgi:hypothetical protein
MEEACRGYLYEIRSNGMNATNNLNNVLEGCLRVNRRRKRFDITVDITLNRFFSTRLINTMKDSPPLNTQITQQPLLHSST